MELLELIKEGDIKGLVSKLPNKESVVNNKKEYNNDRKVRKTQVGKREDKTIKGESGNKIVPVAKIPIPFQRKIVKSASAFLFGNPINLSSDADISDLTNEWRRLRMDSLLLKFAQEVKSSTEAAIAFSIVKDDDGTKLKAQMLKGNLYPVFDEYEDMKAFVWMFKNTSTDYLYVFTAESTKKYKKVKDGWSEEGSDTNLFKKIPIVYMNQENPEWWEVQDMIDRYEMSVSKFADTNDYFASPMYKIKGEVGSFPGKDVTGKAVTLPQKVENNILVEGDVEYLTWPHAPEATKLELDKLEGLIYSMSSTTNVTLESMKGVGNVANYAMQLMFLTSIIKAKWDEGDFRTAIERMISLIYAGSSKMSKPEEHIKVEFTGILPNNVMEIITMLSEATGGQAIMSQEAAVKQNPLVSDPQDEIAKIQSEQGLGETLTID